MDGVDAIITVPPFVVSHHCVDGVCRAEWLVHPMLAHIPYGVEEVPVPDRAIIIIFGVRGPKSASAGTGY